MREVVAMCAPHVHPDRPVHLLGIGRIQDVFDFVRLGIDTFDCVAVTRMARHGTALMKGNPKGSINLRNSKYRNDHSLLDERMNSVISRTYQKAAIHHLLKAEPNTGGAILTQHNICVISTLMREVRQALREGSLDRLEKEWLG
jgi:queuine tRNA-ribosyltransferase